jgi:predicted alpha/beta-fold hydrolase
MAERERTTAPTAAPQDGAGAMRGGSAPRRRDARGARGARASGGFRPAWWVPGPHAQTLWGKLFRRVPLAPTRLERWDTPDGDFVDLVRLDPEAGAGDAATRPRLLLLHGLEGGRRSHYAQGLFLEARRRGWGMDLMLHRTCGDEPNRLRRFYHSGETSDVAFVVDRVCAERPGAPLGLCGVSLGGNVLLKYLGERGAGVPAQVAGAVAVSVPYDLARGSRHIGRGGFSRVYEASFLRSLRRKVEHKLARYPDLVERERLARLRTLWDFDDVVTAPVHGFRDAADYYARSSALGFLAGVRTPTLLLSAVDDPFLPAAVLDDVRAATAGNPALELEFVARGGHVGFVGGRVPWRPDYYAERRTFEFLAGRVR